MSYMFASEEWVNDFQQHINSSADYAEAASTWEGDFYFVVEAGAGMPAESVMYLDLWHGKCRHVEIMTDKAARTPEFVIMAPLPAWKQVIGKKVDPIQALVTRKLKLQGNMLKIMKSVKAAQELVKCATYVPTIYPDEKPA